MIRGAMWSGLAVWTAVWLGAWGGPARVLTCVRAAEGGSASANAASPAGSLPKWNLGEDAIAQALALPTEIDFVDAPLVHVLQYLEDYHRVLIQPDSRAFANAGVEQDTPITRALRGISLDSALDLLLDDLNLAHTIKSDRLFVTTRDEEKKCLIARVYEVSDLVTSTVHPSSWAMAGGLGSVTPANAERPRVLTISQTYRIHKQLAKLFADLHAVANHQPSERR